MAFIVPAVIAAKKAKIVKSKKDEASVHADCKSPQSCKKCRIMHRLGKNRLFICLFINH